MEEPRLRDLDKLGRIIIVDLKSLIGATKDQWGRITQEELTEFIAQADPPGYSIRTIQPKIAEIAEKFERFVQATKCHGNKKHWHAVLWLAWRYPWYW